MTAMKREEELTEAAKSIASMVTEWVEGAQRGGQDFRNGLDRVIALRLKRLLSTPNPEEHPYGYAFQNEETGLQQVVDMQQVELGFEENNPRWQKIGPVYLHPTEPEVAEMREHSNRLQRLLDQQWKRTTEAGELWRQAHPGNDDVRPDLGELVTWLMARAALTAKPDTDGREGE